MGLQINRQQPKRRRCGNGSTPQVRQEVYPQARQGVHAAGAAMGSHAPALAAVPEPPRKGAQAVAVSGVAAPPEGAGLRSL